MKIFVSGVIALLLTTRINGFGYTLAACKAVASKFSNTCTQSPDSAATWYTDFATTYQSCTYMSSCPGGYGKPYACSWPRKLCVSCSETSGVVYMRIQSNTLPSHCSVTKGTPPEWVLDYKIKWNPDVSSSTDVSFASQTAYDNWACMMEKTETVPTTSYFENLNTTGFSSTNDAIVSGIMLNGVPQFSSLSGDLVDPYYPQMWSGVLKSTVSIEDVDACLGHAGGGVYHYHHLPNCVVDSSVDTSKSCSDTTSCVSDISGYAFGSFANSKTLTVVGMAKDGHVMVGPYKSDGTAYDCSTLDQCGGTFLDDGSYVYVMNQYFPYSMNCFGPAMDMKYNASCTTNSCVPSSAVHFSFLATFAAMLFSSLAIFF